MCSDRSTDLEGVVLQANIEYHDLIANSYESDTDSAFIFTPKVQSQIETVVKWLRDRTEGEVWIDVGCGTGNVLKFAAQSFGHAVGFDVSVGMLRLAQERGLDARVADAKALPISSGAADVVSAFSVLHHVLDPKPVLAEAYRILKCGGYFYSDLDPNGLCLVREPALRAIYRHLYKLYLRISCRHPSVSNQEKKISRLQHLAEYHQNQTLGLDPRQIVRDMRDLGFRDVKVYLSFGTVDPARLTQTRVNTSRFSLMINPMFSVIGQK
jgi:ubiquinone/menaquinone biosynthesis C-methylase UbiE